MNSEGKKFWVQYKDVKGNVALVTFDKKNDAEQYAKEKDGTVYDWG